AVAPDDAPLLAPGHPSGRYEYVANSSGSVSQYTIGANGALKAMTPAAVEAGTNPQSVTVDPSGRYAYVTNGDNHIVHYALGSDGSLAPLTPAPLPRPPR